MYREIIELLPSKDLKKKIYEVNHKFSSRELLQIVQDYGKNFNEKLRLWNYILDNASEDKKLIEAYIKYQNYLLEKLHSEGKFYVHISGYNYADYKEYTLNSFNECMSAINYFLDEHYERLPKYVTIEKLRDENDKESLLYGKYALKCVLNEQGQIVTLIENVPKTFACKDSCKECGFQCTHPFFSVFYPSFVDNNEVIKYYHNGRYNFGVCVIALQDPTQYYHIIDLESYVIKGHMYDMEEEMTFVVPLPLIEKFDFNELDDEIKQDYHDFINHNDDDEENE